MGARTKSERAKLILISQGGEGRQERSQKYKDGVMKKSGKGMLHGLAPFQLTPLNYPTELAQAVYAVGSGLSARNINQRVGAMWGSDEVSQVIQCIGWRATTLLSSYPRASSRILDTPGWREAEKPPARVTSGKPVGERRPELWQEGSGPRPNHSLWTSAMCPGRARLLGM